MSSFRRGRVVSVAVLGAMCAMMPVQALTLIDVSGPNNSSTITDVLSNNPGVAFTLASAHNNVSIGVSLLAFGGSGDWNLNAFLTTQIGPGTTAASHEVASVSQVITVPGSPFAAPYTITPTTIFSGLNLAAGTYYLTLSGTYNTQNAWWAGSPTADLSTVTSSGASVAAPYYYFSLPDFSYLPSSPFPVFSNAYGYWFSVTGDLVESNVPEPWSGALLLAGWIVLFPLRRSLRR